MDLKNKSVVILLSGGLDSSTVTGLAKSYKAKIFGLSFDYGQRHKKELNSALTIAKHFALEEFKIIKLDLSLWGGSSLTDPKKDLPIQGIQPNIIPNTYVPGRNTIFISVALSYAEAINADLIGLGVNALDYSGYPDCRPDYIKKFQELANLANKRGREENPIKLWTPLIDLTKEDIIQLAIDTNVPLEKTWSCYSGHSEPCGKCDSCRIRQKALHQWQTRKNEN
tara:strand:- start:1037 stop:1711 length:675 start_codon:yes stop_codon:yes gene_type:complete